MLIITIHVDAPPGHAIGIKEAIAQDLEQKYGDVRVVAVVERTAKQESFFEYGSGISQGYNGKNYGKTWLAYRRKPEEGTT